MKTITYKTDDAVSQMEKCKNCFSKFTVVPPQVVNNTDCEELALPTDITELESLQNVMPYLVNEPNTITVTVIDSQTVLPKLDLPSTCTRPKQGVMSREQTKSNDYQNKTEITDTSPQTSIKQNRPKRACTSASKCILTKRPRKTKLKEIVTNVKLVVDVANDVDGNDDGSGDVHAEPDMDDSIIPEVLDDLEDSKSRGRDQMLKESFGEHQGQYMCKHCSYCTSKKYNLIRHSKKHDSANKQFKCIICNEIPYENQQHLDNHMLNIHKLNSDTSIPCSYCGKTFTCKSVLLKHLIRHEKTKLDCPHCSKEFISRFGLQKHVALKHEKTAKYSCTQCGKLYDRKVLLDEHVMKHSGKALYACLYCKKEYSTRRFYDRHLKRCQNVIGKIPALYEKKDDEFACKMCDYRSKRLFDMRRHEMRHKIDGRPTCETCGKSYSCISTLKEHIGTCHNNIKFICSVCGKMFNARACMNRHISKVHDKRFRHKCQICGKQFFEKLSYHDHMDSHTGTKRHVCHFCGLSYRYKPRLMVHMRKHRDYPLYQCAHCDKKYSTSDSLSQHVAAKHTLDKHWVCEMCGKKFEWNSSYTWHRKKSCPSLQKPLVVPFNETVSQYVINS